MIQQKKVIVHLLLEVSKEEEDRERGELLFRTS